MSLSRSTALDMSCPCRSYSALNSRPTTCRVQVEHPYHTYAVPIIHTQSLSYIRRAVTPWRWSRCTAGTVPRQCTDRTRHRPRTHHLARPHAAHPARPLLKVTLFTVLLMTSPRGQSMGGGSGALGGPVTTRLAGVPFFCKTAQSRGASIIPLSHHGKGGGRSQTEF